MIVTIATLATDADRAALAPIWVDAEGIEYRVASGPGLPADGAWTPDSDEPAPAAPAVIAGVDGFTALAMMGLTRPIEDGE